jgi:predicted RecB family nuclease
VRNQSWVSKTDVTSYLRCPYAFWLTDSGQLDRAELLSPSEAELAGAGIAFERSVVEAAVPVQMPPGGEAELFTQDHTILEVRAFRNPGLRLIGRPDGVVTANGALQPVEIKSHRLLQRSDRIELAFYWLLLGYLRTAGTADPVGWVFLRTQDGTHTREKVELTPDLFTETEELIQAVRRARRHGVEPVWCRCTVCRGARHRQVTEAVWQRRDLSSVSGVGRVRRAALLAAGYASWDDLLNHDAQDIADAVNFALVRPSVSAGEVGRWQAHAQALSVGKPILAGGAGPFPVPGRYIAFDAEYTAENVWLLGARVVRPEGDLCFSVWASPEGEAQALSDMTDILSFSRLPVVTWNGNNADLPALRKAAARTGQRGLLESITAAHVDMYGWTRQNLMLPIPGLGLKEVSEHFGIARESGVTSGLAAEMMWRRYQHTGDQEVKAELVSYNLDDLRSLIHVVECLRACAVLRPPDAAEALHPVVETVVREHEPGGRPAFRPDATLAAPRPGATRNPWGSRQVAGPVQRPRWRELLFKRRRVS